MMTLSHIDLKILINLRPRRSREVAGRLREKWVAYQSLLMGHLMVFLLTTLVIPPHAHSATPPPSTDRLLPQLQAKIPEVADGPFQVWKEKNKYFLIIAVDQGAANAKDLDFAPNNSRKVANTLADLGYKPFFGNTRFLTGEQTKRGMVLSALEAMKDLVPPAGVIIYYSGHAKTEGKEQDLWLQLSGQEKEGPGQGVALSEVVKNPRLVGYKGELVVIIDAGYSGEAALSETLTLPNPGVKTSILSSRSREQNFQALKLSEGKISAFTHAFLEALGPQWATADKNRDGVLLLQELNDFMRIQFQRHFQNKDIPELMTPTLSSSQQEGVFLAYRRDQVQNWFTADRQILQISALERALSPSIRREKVLAKGSSPELGVSKQAEALAQQIPSKTDNLYVKGLIAQAEGRLDETRTFLAKAETAQGASKQKLAKIYLARGRTEIYAGRKKEALPWYKKTLALQPPEEADLLNEFGLVWFEAGLYDEALVFLKEGLRLREKTLDPMDPSLAVSLNNLAGVYHTQGKYTKAQLLYQRALQITERTLGPEHPSIVLQLNNLARLNRARGRYAEAEPLYQRALQITERTLGPDHPNVVTALNNLALVYRVQGKYAEAEPLYYRVLGIDEATHGPTHPNVVFDLSNLALVVHTQGKYAEAEPLYQRALEIDEAIYGPTHPDVAIDLNNLAKLYDDQGKYAEAEPLYQRSYDIIRQRVGLRHPHTQTVLNNYLEFLQRYGQEEKARHLVEEYQQALRPQRPP